jgi:phosphoribosyl-ATP pyrophosphohydrolase
MKLKELYKIITDSAQKNSDGSYVASIIRSGFDRIAQKVGEEAVEVVIAAKNKDKERIIFESADLLFHLLVLLQQSGVSLEDVYNELDARRKNK